VEVSYILGYLAAVFIGLVLGLIGGGGSILTVPVFVYLLGINPVMATAYSLFVVGFTACVGTLRKIKYNEVEYKIGLVFAIPSFIAVYCTRKYLLPALPDPLIELNSFNVSKDLGIMVFFAFIMLMASISMIRNRREEKPAESLSKMNMPLIVLEGAIVGVLTGIVGAGGGFLIIPALVLLANLPMKKAVGTSLLIIALKSLIGFMGDVSNFKFDWSLLLSITGLSVIGIFIGSYLTQWIDGKKLKKAFGWFVLIMAFYILFKECYNL